MSETVITLYNRLQITSKCIFCKRVKHSLHSGRRLLLLCNIKHSDTGIYYTLLQLSSNEKHTRFQSVPVEKLSKNVPVTFLNIQRLFASGEYLRVRRLFDSSNKSSTSINVLRRFTRRNFGTASVTLPYARRTLTRLQTDANCMQARCQMRRGCSDRLFLSSTVCATKYHLKYRCYIWASLHSASGG